MFDTVHETINELKGVLVSLSEHTYDQQCPLLSGASIGQHTRHIIELYHCLFAGYAAAEVNYDNRPRNKTIESERHVAIEMLSDIQNSIRKADKKMKLINTLNGSVINLQTTYFREVLYNLEHTIHHNALLKVAIQHVDCQVKVPTSFGYAPATIEFRKNVHTKLY